ncbi:MAG: cell wall-binding repeat-containing protein [Coriobacteriia bacterium]
MARFVRSARFSLWLAASVILGLVAPSALAALPRAESWIAVSDPLPLGSAAPSAEFALRLPDPAELQWSLLDALTSGESTPAVATGQVTVQVTVRNPDAAIREVTRLAGVDRYETALEASRDFKDGASTVVIATGLNWPDALGGTALAGAVRGPLLLTKTNELPASVKSELVWLGTSKVYILGGTGAVGPAVEQTLKSMGLTVVRLGGVDRYATAGLVADEAIRVLGGTYSGDALVATGTNFPDATGGSALAAALGRPILLVRPTGEVHVPAATRRVTILGGTGAVSAAVEMTLQRQLGASNVVRAGGINRYETAALIAQVGIDAGMTWDGVGVATGEDFPDALAGGAMLGARNSVLLLSTPSTLNAYAELSLLMNAPGINTVNIFGGIGAISADTETSVRRTTGIF